MVHRELMDILIIHQGPHRAVQKEAAAQVHMVRSLYIYSLRAKTVNAEHVHFGVLIGSFTKKKWHGSLLEFLMLLCALTCC
jgi:hypothetical protein